MKRLLAILAVVAVAAGAGVALVFAMPWSDTQTASGNVTATSDSQILHICETEAANPATCSEDDSGANETIFEGDEQLDVGQPPVVEALRLTSDGGDAAFDIFGIGVSFTETLDPGADCTGAPEVTFIRAETAGDDHDPASAPIPGSQAFSDSADLGVIHVDPSGWEVVFVMLRLPPSTPAECIGSAWDAQIAFDARPHD